MLAIFRLTFSVSFTKFSKWRCFHFLSVSKPHYSCLLCPQRCLPPAHFPCKVKLTFECKTKGKQDLVRSSSTVSGKVTIWQQAPLSREEK